MTTLLQKLAALDDAPAGAEDDLPLSALPTAEDYAAAARGRTRGFLLGGAILAAAVAGSFVGFGLDNIALPLCLLVAVLTPILLWQFPRFVLYFTLAAACLFEVFPNHYADSLTDRVPLFLNINMVLQMYGHPNVKALPFCLLEIFFVVAGVCSTLRSVFTGTARLRAGALFVPIMIYVGFVTFGWVNGMMTGGDFKISLQEVRAQFYFLLAYLIAVNLFQERRQIGVILWIIIGCIALKGVLYTFRRYVTLAGNASLGSRGRVA